MEITALLVHRILQVKTLHIVTQSKPIRKNLFFNKLLCEAGFWDFAVDGDTKRNTAELQTKQKTKILLLITAG